MPRMCKVQADFDSAFEQLIGHEGKFQNHYGDRGNWDTGIIGRGNLKGTKFGISAMSYPNLDIEKLALEQAKRIYKQDFWDKFKADKLDGRVAFNVFDAAVHHGLWQAVKLLQKSVKVKEDGFFGPVTLKAVNRENAVIVIARLNANRLLFCANLSSWKSFGRGWANRFANNILKGTE